MPSQLRHVADQAEQNPLIAVRVIPFRAGAHPGLIAPFTLLEFEAGLPDILFLDADQPDSTMIVGGDPRVAEHAENFQKLLELALPDQESIEFIRSAADTMSEI